MSRNAEEGFTLYQELFNKGIEIVFLKEHYIDTKTYRTALNNKIDLVGMTFGRLTVIKQVKTNLLDNK